MTMKMTVTKVLLLLLASQVSAQNILDVALNQGCIKFYDWMNTSAYIMDEMVDVADTYTLFAVKDADLPDQAERLMDFIVPVLRARYMSFFIANGTYRISDFVNDKVIDTAAFGPYSVRQLRMNKYDMDGSTLYTIDGRPIVQSDISASNGVVHLIEGFLAYETDTIEERISRTSYYSTLQTALTKVDLLDMLSGDKPYTMFAPDNEAFNKLISIKENDTRILDFDYPLKGILQGHIVEDTYFDDSLYDGLLLPTIGYGRSIQFAVDSFGNITLNGQARVVEQRIMKNGVIYQIDGVLTIDTDLRDGTMMDVAQDLGLDWMLHYLHEGELYDMLRGDVEGGATLYGLEDSGFTDLMRSRLDFLLPVLLNKYMIYYIANGTYSTGDMTNDRLVPSLEESRHLRFNVYGDQFNPVYTVAGRPLIKQNQQATNGLVHTVGTFLSNPTWASCGSYIELAGSLSELETIMTTLGYLDVLKGDGPFTVFAPINEAFQGVDISNDTWMEIFDSHVVESTYYEAGLTNDLRLTTRSNQIITVTVDPATKVITLNGHSNITMERVVGNGVLYLVKEILFADGNVIPSSPPTTAHTQEMTTTTASNSTATTTTDGGENNSAASVLSNILLLVLAASVARNVQI